MAVLLPGLDIAESFRWANDWCAKKRQTYSGSPTQGLWGAAFRSFNDYRHEVDYPYLPAPPRNDEDRARYSEEMTRYIIEWKLACREEFGRSYYEVIVLPTHAVEWRDVPAADLNTPGTWEPYGHLQAAHDYAAAEGYPHGFPTFHQADYGQGPVYGIFLINPDFVEWRDVSSTKLFFPGFPRRPTKYPLPSWFSSANRFALKNGYDAGMPNGHHRQLSVRLPTFLWVIGIQLFPPGLVRREKVSLQEAYNFLNPTGPPLCGGDY